MFPSADAVRKLASAVCFGISLKHGAAEAEENDYSTKRLGRPRQEMTPPHQPESNTGQESLRERLRAAHFHDYTSTAFRMWLAIALAGAAAFLWAAFQLGKAPAGLQLQTFAGLLLVATAAWFPIELPRSKYSISPSDAFIFTMLAMLGTPAAILGAGVEGTIGAWRSTKRVTSRISTPAAAMAAMAVCGTLFDALVSPLVGLGLSPAVAKFAALVATAFVPFTLTTLSLMATVTLKRGAWPNLGDWFNGFSWVAAVYLGAALVAGLVQLGAAGHGSVVRGPGWPRPSSRRCWPTGT